MLIRDMMTPNVDVIRPDATLQEAAQKMRSLDVGPLPVCDGERLVGMLTDRDITVRATAEGKDPKSTPVRDVMTPDVIYCHDDRDLDEAARLMERHQIRRLLVMDKNQRLVGIISLGDLATRSDRENEELDEEVLEQVSQPGTAQR